MFGVGVRSPSTPGPGIGVGASPSAGGGGEATPNPNLLLWSEELDRAATWTTIGDAVVTANQGQDPDGNTTAEQVNLAGGAVLRQVSTVAVSSGGPFVTAFIPDPTRRQFSVSGAFDGTTYVFSGYHQDPLDSGLEVGVIMQNVGGFIEVRFRDTGDEPTVLLSWLKLESASLTAYVKREGT